MRGSIAAASIRRPVAVWIVILICVLGGLWGMGSVGRLEDPGFTLKTALVFTPYPGATADEVESEVSEPLESAIQQMPQLRRIESKSMPGLSQLTVEIEDTYGPREMPQIWDELRRRIGDARDSLPQGALDPIINDDFGDVYGLYYAVSAEGYSPRQMREIARQLRRGLVTVDGVAKVDIGGLIQEDVVVEISATRLESLGLPPAQLVGAIATDNAVLAQGTVASDLLRLRLGLPPGYATPEGIEALRVGQAGATGQLSLADIATVRREISETPDLIVTHGGAQVFTLGVSAITSRNVVEVGHAVEARLRELMAELPPGVTLSPIYEQHKVVDQAVSGFIISLGQSVGIVVAALMVAMGWRAGVVVGSTLLLTVMATVMFMAIFGIEMERISLGALIIAMGMLVDNAIVIAEGMVIGIDQGKTAEQAAADTEAATGIPLLGATIIGIMAFSGIGLSPDATGEFMFSLFAVIGISLLLSWILGVTVTPWLGAWLLRPSKSAGGGAYAGRLYRVYGWLLRGSLRARWLVVAVVVATTLASVMVFGGVKQQFFPASTTPLFYVHYSLPRGADIASTQTDLERIAARLAEAPGVTDVTTFAGGGAARFMLTYQPEQPDPSYGLALVRVQRAEDIPALVAELSRTLPAEFPAGHLRIEELVFGPPTGADVALRISGDDPAVLRALAAQAQEIMRDSGVLRDLRHDWRQPELAIVPIVDEARMRLAGITRSAIADTILYGSSGLRAGSLREGDTQLPILLRRPEAERSGPEGLIDLSVWSDGAGGYVPMRQVVDRIEIRTEEALIHRRDRVRTLTVQGEAIAGLTADQAFRKLRPMIEAMPLPPGYRIEWGGEYESSTEAQASLAAQLPLGFLVMLVISVLMFNRLRQPAIIWLVVPMAVTGMSLGLLATGLPFTFTALLGLLSLSGMLMKNAIVLVEEIDARRHAGDPPLAALVDGAISRLRPVLLAAVTTIFGMLPLLADAFFASMAVTIMGGLAFATVLTMIVVPVLYGLMFGIRVGGRDTGRAGPAAQVAG
ncbi:efflux RND transporter permease subunit [Paracoccus bogoriensis]|uniref:efflux RND transporter permease subunit n=1 Tax=Paracoccus bogoriensis TaxID=242065 RepID=UPI001C672296|nr:efflux RND transporter permease subunit [Paracoccus bogoriensis]MBW7056000.1 efflux RND transporter permease subunit [Paracoccus bogoriensis]